MNVKFDKWLRKTYGISVKDLGSKSSEERKFYWSKYCEHRNQQVRAYNREIT